MIRSIYSKAAILSGLQTRAFLNHQARFFGSMHSRLNNQRFRLSLGPSVIVLLKRLSRPSTRVKTFFLPIEIGESVAEDEVVIVVESAKGEAPVRSTSKGVITSFLWKEGDDVKIGAPMFELDTDAKPTVASAEPAKKEEPKKQEQAAPKAEAPKPAAPTATAAAPKPAAAAPTATKAASGDSVRFSRLSSLAPS